MALKTYKVDIAEYLKTPEDIRDFLEEALENGTEEEFIHALSIASRAMGMAEIAKKAGVTRASLYKSLSGEGNPGFKTISKVTKALGCRITVAGA
jgi:probable addiction module antidote protein